MPNPETASARQYRRNDPEGKTALVVTVASLASPTGPSARRAATMTSALTRHELTGEIPSALDHALPRGTRHPVGPVVARWHSFDPHTFNIGRGQLTIEDGISVGLYCAERSIIDAFNTRGTTGTEIAVEALRRWLRQQGSQPAELLTMATAWPRVQAPLRRAIEILLSLGQPARL